MPIPRITSQISTERAPRPRTATLLVDATPRRDAPPPATRPTARQYDILEYAYQEETAGPLPLEGVTIPACPGAARPLQMYGDAVVLERMGLVTLNTHSTARVNTVSQREMPWHYTWVLSLTDEGRALVQRRIGAALARALPSRSAPEKARRAVPDPSVGADAPVPDTTPEDSETEFVFS
jgi:hypothetical protein